MSSTNPALGRDEPIARHVRPLPNAPSLEYERKEAKALLKQMRAADADALRRVQEAHPVALRDRQPRDLKLADAQHVIAREYGFASWPRLVEYFEELERHRNAPRYNSDDDGIDRFKTFAQSIVRRHQRGDPIVARELAHFVPRFFARPIAEILATPITEDEARLVVARERRRMSWEELIERAEASRGWRERKRWEGTDTPHERARVAVHSHDVAALAALLDEHPELLSPSVVDREWQSTLAGLALSTERGSTDIVQGVIRFTPAERNPDARRVTDLLASRGVDIQRELDERLLGRPHDEAMPKGGMQPDTVRWYLDRGANPNWMPPNGIPVLEHAIVRYRSSACVDLIAKHVTPRRALWIAAGLGDVSGVRSFIAGKQKLTREGRLNRPDLMAMGSVRWFPPNHEADDLEIMYEAFQIAGWNERWATMDALLDAGLPVDHTPIGWPLVLDAVGNLIVPLAEYLISRGSDLDREWPGHGSARSVIRSIVANLHDPQTEKVCRMLEICNAGTVEEILATVDAKRQSPPPPEERTLRAMQLAADDAARQGQSVVTTENMLVGLLRVNNGVFAEFFHGTGTDVAKLRARIGARLLPDSDPLTGQELPADALAAAALQVAAAEADSRRRSRVGPIHLMAGIVSQETGPAVQVLREAGMTVAQMSGRLKSAC
jgi:hypothetical protein